MYMNYVNIIKEFIFAERISNLGATPGCSVKNVKIVCSYRAHLLCQKCPIVFARDEKASRNASLVVWRVYE